MGGDGNLPVGPGIWGFAAFFVLALALWLLARNMNSRLRRMAYTDRDRAQEAERATGQTMQELAAPERTADDGVPDPSTDATGHAGQDEPTAGTEDGAQDQGLR